MKKVIYAFSLVAASSVALTGCGRNRVEAEAHTLADEVITVRTEKAAAQRFERRTTVQGNLVPFESAVVASRVAGPLVEVCVDVGDKARKGETMLFRVDSAQLENQRRIAEETLNTARAQLAVAEANLAKARAEARKVALDADRYARLHGEGRVSDNEYETAMTRNDSAKATVAAADASVRLAGQQISQAEASLLIADRNLSDAALYAPIDGEVSARLKEPGERVNPGDPVVKISGTGKVKAIAFLPAQHYDDVKEGETEFGLSSGGADMGMHKVAAKSPVIDMTLRTFEMRGVLENAEGAVPGKMADFRVVFEARDGIGIPEEAVLVRRGGEMVFVNDGGLAKPVMVRTGLRTDGRIEILDGLSGGEEVIVEGQTQLTEGRAIRRM